MSNPSIQSAPSLTDASAGSAPTAEGTSPAGAPDLQSEHPPNAPLVLRVGVIGDRSDPKIRHVSEVAAMCVNSRKLLLHIQNTFVDMAKTHRKMFAKPGDDKLEGLRLISGLSQGAAQWVAAEAEQLGYKLQVVLPFGRAEYKNGFADSRLRDEYCRLLKEAKAVFELDGRGDRAGESYLAADRVLLNQTDLLIAVYDWKDEQETGGAGQIVREALQRGIPVVSINWQAPATWLLRLPPRQLFEQPSETQDDVQELERQVSGLLLPPDAYQDGEKSAERKHREEFFRSRRRSWTPLGGWWNFFRDWLRVKLLREATPEEEARESKGLGGRLAKLRRLRMIVLKCRVPKFIEATEADWKQDWQGTSRDPRENKLAPQIISWIEKSYLAHYAWSNQLSIYYANHYRSSFVWIYLLGTLAVFMALIGHTAHVSHFGELIFIAVEILIISAIIWLRWYGGRRRWHERSIDYRILAERLRLVRFNCLLGGVWQQVNLPSHLMSYGSPAATWMNWHARAVERAAGLPDVVVNKEYLSACKELLLKGLLAGQIDYHKKNSEGLGSVDYRLHRLGEVLFLVTLAACIFHFVTVYLCWTDPWNRWLIFGAAFLPALGGAMAAIRSQGEFHRLVQRSRAMSAELNKLDDAVKRVQPESNSLSSQALQKAVEQTTRLMYNETLDWHIVFQDRPLVWPA